MKIQHQKLLKEIFQNPIKKNIEFQEIENLLIALGAEVHKGNGSRVRFIHNDIPIAMHRPHPEKEAKDYQIKQLREFLEELGYKI